MISTDQSNFSTNEERWENLSQSIRVQSSDVTTEETAFQTNESKHSRCRNGFSYIVTLQLIICLLFLTFVYLTQAFLPDLFVSVKNGYNKQITTSLYFEGDFSKADFSGLFIATSDEF